MRVKIRLSRHVRNNMKLYGILEADVAEAIQKPDSRDEESGKTVVLKRFSGFLISIGAPIASCNARAPIILAASKFVYDMLIHLIKLFLSLTDVLSQFLSLFNRPFQQICDFLLRESAGPALLHGTGSPVLKR